jgi:hypothetical protein
MSSQNTWESLLKKAFKQLDAGGLSGDSWTLGGGTVLMFHFAHRLSKDIDIFFPDRQLLGMVSPRLNSGVEDSLSDYIEQDRFCKLLFAEGKIDFIYSQPVTVHAPQPRMLAGRLVRCEDPVEIAAKKVFWRNDRFTPRDIFDLAVVYDAGPTRLIEALADYPEQTAALAEQIKLGVASGDYDKWAAIAPVLPAGERFLKSAPQNVTLLLESVERAYQEN